MKIFNRKINLETVCRACLSERGHLREIFSTKLPKMMETCADIQVSENDDIPPYVCVSCFHLIAKFYTYKKKMERSDRILRAYLKQTKKKQKDILNIAISQAEIGEITNPDFVHLEISGVVDDEDIPLSELKKQQNVHEADLKTDSKVLDVNYLIRDRMEMAPGEVVNASEPPPLVPLETSKKTVANHSSEALLKNLPEEPPPLVPIKPILDAGNVLTNVLTNQLNLECTNCCQEFNSVEALKEHKLTVCQTLNNSLRCSICRKEFRDRKRLIGHLKGHMVTKDYLCKICGKRYPNPSTFRIHMRTHTGERPFKCQICNKGFVRWAGVAGHMRTHQPYKPYICQTCGKAFKIASNLERHKVLHMESLPFCCNYCGKTFSQSDNLQLHIRTYHTNERPYLCNICGKGFVSSTRLNRHMWVHSGFKPYRCRSCPKGYSNSNDLRNHESQHLGGPKEQDKPHVCHLCKMRFYHPCRLAKHMKTHERPFSCSVCFKSFTSNSLLVKHLVKCKKEAAKNADNHTSAEQIFVNYH